MSRRAIVCAALLLAGLSLPCLGQENQPIPFSDEAVDKAIQSGKKYLWSQYDKAEGHWPEFGDYTGGLTALVSYALLSSGESYQGPEMKRTLAWLSRLDMTKTYCLALRCQVWALLPAPEEEAKSRPAVGSTRQLLAKDADRLIKSICQPNSDDGHYIYKFGAYTYESAGKPATGGDHSNTQYGILGVWAAAANGVNVPQKYWEWVYNHFKMTQCEDGGWQYHIEPLDRGISSMTAAGLASLFVAYDFFCREKFNDVGYDPTPVPIKSGLAWFEKNLEINEQTTLYGLYGIERVGMASGYKFFGAKDWYKMGARHLINTQMADGSWQRVGLDGGEIGATSFAILFLVRGQNPILFNRLQYPGDWNNRPRALANVTRWLSRAFEREVGWQIIDLYTDVQEWHDAPILVITGSEPPEFADSDLDKLRAYVYQGGTILSINEGKSVEFDEAIRGKGGLYEKLFPGYPVGQLPPDHELFSCHGTLKNPKSVYGVSNGLRLMAIHCSDDLPLSWQTDARATAPDDFTLAANIVIYVTDRNLRHRGTSLWPASEAFTARRVAQVARVQYEGNWDPEPLALTRVARLMGKQYQIQLDVVTRKLTELDARKTPIAFLTGTGELKLSEAEKKAWKAYVDAGGTMVLDAGGGSDKFADSATALMAEIFGGASVKAVPSYSPVYRMAGLDINAARYRRAARARLSNAKNPRLWGADVGQRTAVFLSREDLTAGLTGYSSFSNVGYEPSSAFEIVRNILFYALGEKPPVAATAKARPAMATP